MSIYTPDLVSALQDLALETGEITYAQAVAFADKHGLKPRSVIAKIKSMELIYVPKPVNVTKRGEPVVRKSELVASIEAAVGVAVPSLVKASKADLEALMQAVAQS